jgi:hypothetical protein
MTAPMATRSGSHRCDLRSRPSSIHSIDSHSSWCGRQNCSTSSRLIAWDRRLHVRRLHPRWGGRDARNGSHHRRGPSDPLGPHCFVPLGSGGSGAPKRRDGSAVVTARAFEGF